MLNVVSVSCVQLCCGSKNEFQCMLFHDQEMHPRNTRSKEHQAVKTLMLIYMHSRNVDMKCILWLTNI